MSRTACISTMAPLTPAQIILAIPHRKIPTRLVPSHRRSRRLAADRVDCLVQLLEEEGAVPFAEGRGATRDGAHIAEVGEDVADCERVADAAFGEELASGVEDEGALLDASGGKGDIGGDDDIVLSDVLGDPVVGGVEVSTDDDLFHAVVVWDSEEGVGDEDDAQGMAFRHPVDLLFDRAAISID